MLIKDFIKNVTDFIQYDAPDIREFIYRKALYETEKKVLTFLKTRIKFFSKEFIDIPPDLIKVPFTIYSIRKFYLNNIPIFASNKFPPTDNRFFYEKKYYQNQYNIPLRISQLLSVNIPLRKSTEKNGVIYEFFEVNPQDGSLNQIPFAYIYDNENVLYTNYLPDDDIQIALQIRAVNDIIRIRDNDLEIVSNYGYLKIQLGNVIQDSIFYLAEDGSLYSDYQLTNLIKRNSIISYSDIVSYNPKNTNDKIDIIYLENPYNHINLNENDELLDLYYSAIFYGVIVECFNFLKQPDQMKVNFDLFNNELIILKQTERYSEESQQIRKMGR